MVEKEDLVRQLGESISQGKDAQRQVEHRALKVRLECLLWLHIYYAWNNAEKISMSPAQE